ncbi:FAD dependent oxidoreductase-domain-containing protein [Dipodascopsis tothii]|uniref:FAD dependent oxidoreductase-domain-containing protein n=1 Tax=Dipodascopsis tothii TaxID=44089 RepID=UPI0034CEBBE3
MFAKRLLSGTGRKIAAGAVVGGGLLLTGGSLVANDNAAASVDTTVPLKYPIPGPFKKLPTREEQLERLKTEKFDVLIIGGGATGAGCALDAASRGLKVALVERDDFGCGTSSRSTKLVHGGVRYLEKAFWNLDIAQYNLVKEALAERATFLHIAPHLSFALPIMIPVYTYWQIPYFWVGTKVYDLVAGSQNLVPSYFMTRKRTLEAFPMLKEDGLTGGLVYYDGSHNDARMNTSIVLTAAQEGAVTVNHLEVVELTKDASGKLVGAVGRDKDGSIYADKITIEAKSIINATGPYSDAVRSLDAPTAKPIVAPSSGVHVVLPDYYAPRKIGLIDPATSDGRVIFFLPWQGHTLAGTTDAPCTIQKDPIPTNDEISWIMNEIQNYVSDDIVVRREDVLAAWSGIRPLVRDPHAKNTESLVRNHLITVSDSGLVTIAGGKWTTYRQMAEECIDEVVSRFNLTTTGPCRTKNLKLVGADHYRDLLYIHLIQTYGIETEVAKHLAENYGDRAYEVLELSALTGERFPLRGVKLAPQYNFLDGEVRYATRNEYARTAQDVISRRLRLAFLNSTAALEALPVVIDIMAEELKWDSTRKEQEWNDTVKYLFSMGLPTTEVISRSQVEDGSYKTILAY